MMAVDDVVSDFDQTGDPQSFQPGSGVEWLTTAFQVSSGAELLRSSSAGVFSTNAPAATSVTIVEAWNATALRIFTTNSEYVQISGGGGAKEGFSGIQTK